MTIVGDIAVNSTCINKLADRAGIVVDDATIQGATVVEAAGENTAVGDATVYRLAVVDVSSEVATAHNRNAVVYGPVIIDVAGLVINGNTTFNNITVGDITSQGACTVDSTAQRAAVVDVAGDGTTVGNTAV